jgi:hypothetical protein
MKYGTSQPVAQQQPDLEPDAKNRCVRTAWAAGYKPTGKPVATWSQTPEGWRLVITVEVESRIQPEPEPDDLGFA